MNSIASFAFERFIACLLGGAALTAIVWLVLRLTARKSSQARFLVWFSTLVAIAILPFISLEYGAHGMGAGSAKSSLITMPSFVGVYLLLGWMLIAAINLVRVFVGVLQLRRLRSECTPADPQILGEELNQRIAALRRTRPVSILISQRIHVPTAVGFIKPAVILPAWLAQGGPREELTHIVLHELEHLRRWDDWTNLAARVLKSLLFFHPGAWWVDRQLSLEREMACDDAVLAATPHPARYARSLALVAEKSILRKQIALAQAAVARMQQLTVRVSRILSAEPVAASSSWKLAVPGVTVLALLCGVSMSWSDGLISLRNDGAMTSTKAGGYVVPAAEVPPAPVIGAHATPVELKYSIAAKPMQAKLVHHRAVVRSPKHEPQIAAHGLQVHQEEPQIIAGGLQVHHNDLAVAADKTKTQAQQQFVLVMARGESVSQTPRGLQIRVWQLQFWVPAQQAKKQVPNKT